MSRRSPLRPARFDDLGLRRALSDRLLPALVAAMTFLAALTLAGALAAASMAEHWRQGAAAVLTVQVPRPRAAPATATDDGTRLDRVTALLRGTPGVIRVRVLSDEELADLLRPWLGNDAQAMSLPLPAVVEVRLAPGDPDLPANLAARLNADAPGTFVESHGVWLQRLTTLARSLQACALAALILVAAVAGAVVMIATRAGLSARRDAIEIVHGLGATDGFIAGRFAQRATALAAAGACVGAVLALPVLLALARLAAPFGIAEMDAPPELSPSVVLSSLPLPLWLALPGLPTAAALIGWVTAQGTVRRWLRRLP
jgi:cell division transport system permease protein